jgi:phosphoribosylaminoimidazolecarboxamide formyltransferase/IMP cyclohydrolase
MRRALLSVTDKSGLADFAARLSELGFELISTGGSAKALREAGLAVKDVSEVTGFPEMLDGRVKTLHPMVHGGLLGDRRLPSHVQAMEAAGISGIEVLCVNLYAFEKTVTQPHEFEDAVESIDIGGPAMIRAAAKNHANVLVVVDPKDYAAVANEIESGISEATRLKLAAKAFRHTAYYDSMIARYLTEAAGDSPWNETLTMGWRWDGASLRYGENPHQQGARYLDPLRAREALQAIGQSSKEISYNNWLDADAAWAIAQAMPEGACAIVKHGNPCGAAIGSDLGESYRLARASDPISAFGGIVAFNGVIDEAAVEAMTDKGNFLEVVIGRGWQTEALMDRFTQRGGWTENVRFLKGSALSTGSLAFRSIAGGCLIQENDAHQGEEHWRVASQKAPTAEQWSALRLMWAIVPFVKSNAIVVGNARQLLGTGAGQMNRVQSVRLALEQAGDQSRGAVLASDAFFPFPDSIHAAADAGIAAIIQPGGSKKDADVISAANERGIAMILTGTRHFRH